MLHIPENMIQEVIQQLLQICELAQPLLHNAVMDILKQHTNVDDSVVEELVRAAAKSNVTMKFCSKDGPLSTTKRRAAYVNKNFTEFKPVGTLLKEEKK